MLRLNKTARYFLLPWLLVALALLFLYAVTGHFTWQMTYYYVWLLGFGLPMWSFRRRLRVVLRKWKWGESLKFALLAYGMVLLEEVFAALFNHLTEGFRLELYLVRVLQFWALNIFAFTGLIVASGFLFLKVGYTRFEMFVLAGLTGLFSEHILYSLWAAPVVFAVLAPIILFTYGLILSPALLSVRPRRVRTYPSLVRYLLFFSLWLVLSIPSILVLVTLRSHFPDCFPPTKFIP